MPKESPGKEEIETIVTDCLKNVLEDSGKSSEGISTDSWLIGDDGLIDSVEFLSVIVAAEEEMEARYGATDLLLVEQSDLMHEDGPFRRVNTLAAHIFKMVQGV